MTQYSDPPRYEPYASPSSPGMVCPKCRGAMRTYERNGIHLEQCDNCRGVFLDFGELEHLTQLEARFNSTPPQYGPSWKSHGGHRYQRGGFSGLFFSS